MSRATVGFILLLLLRSHSNYPLTMETKNPHDVAGTSLFSDSDFESLSSSVNKPSIEAETCYWFGRKYFECVLAQQILSECTADHAPSTMDVSLSRKSSKRRSFANSNLVSTVPSHCLLSVQCLSDNSLGRWKRPSCKSHRPCHSRSTCEHDDQDWADRAWRRFTGEAAAVDYHQKVSWI